jgi:hypothetical protein
MLGINRLGKQLDGDDLISFHIDHVISLPELNVSDPRQVQLWRCIAMWDPMRARDNLEKGSGKLVCLVKQQDSNITNFFHKPSRQIYKDNHMKCSALNTSWAWVKTREEAFQEARGECKCGLCVSDILKSLEGMDEEQQKEVNNWLISRLYFGVLLKLVLNEGEFYCCFH